MNPQVLVAGAGPVGLTMAAELARYGVSVRIVDKTAARTDKSKALVLWSRTLELLDRAACGDGFVSAGNKVLAANIIAGRKVVAHINFDGVDSPHPYALMLPQSETERLLEEHLGRLGVTVERTVELIGFAAADAGVTARLRHGDGREEIVESAWLVGCDGAHSSVRHTLDLPFAGEAQGSDWMLADIHLSGLPFPPSELAIYFHQDGPLVFFPITPGRYRVVAEMGPSAGPRPPDPTLTEVQAVVDRRGPGGVSVSDPVWLSGFRINERKVADYRIGRVFVAGDAAHVHSPAGGQGMNTGMQDAFNLAWKLALACRGAGSPDRLLDSYSAERSAVGDQVLAAAGRMTAMAVLKNHAAQAVRNVLAGVLFGLAPVRRAMADNFTELSIGYPHSPLNGPAAHGVRGPAPGERVRPADGETPVGAGGTPRFALYGVPGEAASGLIGAYPDLLEPAVRPPLGAGGMWLVRPDGYVAAVARDGDAGPLDAWLRALRPAA